MQFRKTIAKQLKGLIWNNTQGYFQVLRSEEKLKNRN